MDSDTQQPTQQVQTPAQPVQTPVSPSTPPKSSNKLLMVIGVLAVLLLVSFVGYTVLQSQTQKTTPTPVVVKPTTQPSPTPDATANGKTYTNQNLKISFNYPNNLFLIELPNYSNSEITVLLTDSEDKVSYVKQCDRNVSTCEYDTISINIIRTKKEEKQSITDYINSTTKSDAKYFTPITVDGKSGLQLEGILSGRFVWYFINEGESVVHINSVVNKDTYTDIQKQETSKDMETVKKILSTLKFTDQNQNQNLKRITLKENYYFDVSVPPGYVLKNGQGDYVNYITDSSGKEIIGFLNTSAGGKKSPPLTDIIIDGVTLEMEYQTSIRCPMSINSKHYKGIQKLYFGIYTWCKDEKDTQDPVYKEVIESIKFSPQLKDMLQGKTEPPLL